MTYREEWPALPCPLCGEGMTPDTIEAHLAAEHPNTGVILLDITIGGGDASLIADTLIEALREFVTGVPVPCPQCDRPVDPRNARAHVRDHHPDDYAAIDALAAKGLGAIINHMRSHNASNN